jgi:hypothetical protein
VAERALRFGLLAIAHRGLLSRVQLDVTAHCHESRLTDPTSYIG